MFTESEITKEQKYKKLHKNGKKSYRKNIQELLKSFICDWKKLLVYATVFAFAVLKVFGLRDDNLDLLKTRRLKGGRLGLHKNLIKCIVLRQGNIVLIQRLN